MSHWTWTGGLSRPRAILSWLVTAAIVVVAILSFRLPAAYMVTGIASLVLAGVLLVIVWPSLTIRR